MNDCTALHNGMDCLERKAKKRCASCKRARQRWDRGRDPRPNSNIRAEKLRDLQDDLDSYAANLTDCHISPYGDEAVETGVDVMDLFEKVIEARIGDAAHHWLDHMSGIRISTLRSITKTAREYGLSELADILRSHIALRRRAA